MSQKLRATHRPILYILLAILLGSTPALGGEVIKQLGQDTGGALKVIVIDPGHGGKDSGATGQSGIKEKNITLRIARALKARLKEQLNVHVILTRNGDSFITLEDRTRVANKAAADIFISIHANAAHKKGASGVETYFLNHEASDSYAMETAAFENSVAELAKDEESRAISDLNSILTDLNRSEAHHESGRLAEIILESLIRSTGGENRGVKQAPFIVLTNAKMPAVLLEVGFISNPKEERELSSSKKLREIASAITDGIIGFEKQLMKTPGYATLNKGDYEEDR
jgi:N-acetylmuramoyl-L-alanine amidase